MSEQLAFIKSDDITLTGSNNTAITHGLQTALFPRNIPSREIARHSPDELQFMATNEILDEADIHFTQKEKVTLSKFIDPIAAVDKLMASELTQECLLIKGRNGTLSDMIQFIEASLTADSKADANISTTE
ncbi:MAG: hypothetical protein D8B38_03470 [Candidatus Saccharimonas sp.]|nr:MAG: hypothetical protein D8B38_03470 [Candidatus Saccharimonas sp.]